MAVTDRRLRPSRVPERAEQQHIVQLARTVGAKVWVLGTTRRRGDFHGTMQTPGISDLVLFLPRRDMRDTTLPPMGRELVFFEVKAHGGRLCPEQQDFRQQCLAAGATHLVGNLDTFIAFLIDRGLARRESFPAYRQPKEASCPAAR